jgi:hypothetical protein
MDAITEKFYNLENITMKKFNMSVLAIAIAASASSQAAITFDFSVLGGVASYNKTSFSQTDSASGLTLTATTDGSAFAAGRVLAAQPNGIGLGVGLPNSGNPWTIVLNENLIFTLTDANDNLVDFTLDKMVVGEGGLFGWGERASVIMGDNSYKVGGNNLNNAQDSKKWIQQSNAINTANGNRGSQFSWGEDGVDGADVVNSFMLRMDNPGSGTSSIRFRSVELTPVAAAVPVPAAAWLFGSALMGLTVAKRRK